MNTNGRNCATCGGSKGPGAVWVCPVLDLKENTGDNTEVAGVWACWYPPGTIPVIEEKRVRDWWEIGRK